MLTLGGRTFPDGRPLVMAIVNRTPDSFYDRGSTYAEAAALDRVERVLSQGADIVDIGGVPAGAGPAVDVAEELRRTVRFLGRVRDRHATAVLSIDTWRHEVADAACRAGADLINDAWGGFDPRVAEVAAAHQVGLVCTHTGGLEPRTVARRATYDDVVAEVLAATERLARRAERLGVPRQGILLDPAHDFGKTTAHSLEITRRLGEIAATGRPVLVSLSRKDFVGETLDLPVAERLPATLAATAVAAWQGARVFRAHDVAETRQVLDMVAAIRGSRTPVRPVRGLG